MARLLNARTLVLGGLAIGAAVGALKNREALAGLIGVGSNVPEPYPAPAAAPAGVPAMQRDEPAPPPAVANADVAGPPENTATHVPAPDPLVHDDGGGIDEAAEEAAAAAEAANIGGAPADYPSEEDSQAAADEAHRPLEEAGEGYAEGQELSESDLADNAEPSAGDPVEGGRAVDDAIAAQDEPLSGEIVEGTPMGETEPLPDEAPADPRPADDPPPIAEVVPEAEYVTAEPDEPTMQIPLPSGVADAPPPPTGEPFADAPPPPTGEPFAGAPPAPPAETRADEKSTAVWRTREAGEQDEEPPTRSETADGA